MNMITLDSVSFYYPNSEKSSLDNISINIETGEMVAIMGANGSGKSTFARIVAGLSNPTRGIVRTSKGAEKSSIGFLFQNPDNQLVAMTVEKELVFNLENKGCSQNEMDELLNKTLTDFNITHLRKRLTSELSGGEKQKIALASVMIDEPDILILDEPDSYLDKTGIDLLLSEIKRLKDKNKNLIVIHITQYLSLADHYQRLLIFDDGKIIKDTTTDFQNEIYKTKLDTNQTKISDLLFNQYKNTKTERINQIDFKNISFAYGDNELLKNISFHFQRGEITGIIGDSGTGKSTLGQLIVDLLKPDSGSISYIGSNGQEIKSGIQGRIVFAFQFPEKQFFLNSVTEEISYGPDNFGNSLKASEIKDILNLVGLEYEKFYDRDPFSLSGGEQRRLALAVVTALKADFIILDEPTCGLDLNGVEQVKKILLTLKDLGVGIIIISHDGNLITELSDKLIQLHHSKSHRIYKKSEISQNISDLTSLIY